LRCKRKDCHGTIVNMGWYYGCILCCREISDKMGKKLDEKSRGILHLDPIHVEKVKEGEFGIYTDRVRYDPRLVLNSSGDTYIGEKSSTEEYDI
jgi:hypothetical protein